jgi:hypothetical protein
VASQVGTQYFTQTTKKNLKLIQDPDLQAALQELFGAMQKAIDISSKRSIH